MADLNALIAQGAQFAAPIDPFAQYGKMQQLQQGDTANQLNQMKMQEMQAANTERNALRQLDPTSPDYESQLFRVNPTMGIAYRKEAATASAQQATQKAQQAEALKTNLANHRSFLVGVNDQPSYDAWRALTIKNIPDLASILPAQFSPDTKDGLLKTADDISKRLTAAPPAPPATVAEFNFARTPDGGNFKGSYQDFITARAVAGRAPAMPSAPVIVRDPITGEERYASREEAITQKMTPGSSDRLKPIPTQINQAIIKNVQTLKQLDDTISLLGKNPNATGYKGYLPGAVLNRMDPEGVDARAGVADIGSLVLHDRSGAAVTAAESPRLMPFIPLSTDDDKTVLKKLKRMREIAASEQLGLTETYSKDQGYKANPLVSKPEAAPSPVTDSNVVVTPDGKSHTFPTPAAAAQFKKAAGIK